MKYSTATMVLTFLLAVSLGHGATLRGKLGGLKDRDPRVLKKKSSKKGGKKGGVSEIETSDLCMVHG
jgi:hypothetical protein